MNEETVGKLLDVLVYLESKDVDSWVMRNLQEVYDSSLGIEI